MILPDMTVREKRYLCPGNGPHRIKHGFCRFECIKAADDVPFDLTDRPMCTVCIVLLTTKLCLDHLRARSEGARQIRRAGVIRRFSGCKVSCRFQDAPHHVVSWHGTCSRPE